MSKAGIYHRDLTLDNILAIKEGSHYQFKVCDFGVSGTPEDF